jgi:hypothetical protein
MMQNVEISRYFVSSRDAPKFGSSFPITSKLQDVHERRKSLTDRFLFTLEGKWQYTALFRNLHVLNLFIVEINLAIDFFSLLQHVLIVSNVNCSTTALLKIKPEL